MELVSQENQDIDFEDSEATDSTDSEETTGQTQNTVSDIFATNLQIIFLSDNEISANICSLNFKQQVFDFVFS